MKLKEQFLKIFENKKPVPKNYLLSMFSALISFQVDFCTNYLQHSLIIRSYVALSQGNMEAKQFTYVQAIKSFHTHFISFLEDFLYHVVEPLHMFLFYIEDSVCCVCLNAFDHTQCWTFYIQNTFLANPNKNYSEVKWYSFLYY